MVKIPCQMDVSLNGMANPYATLSIEDTALVSNQENDASMVFMFASRKIATGLLLTRSAATQLDYLPMFRQ